MKPEYSMDMYDRYASWILNRGEWENHMLIKRYGFMKLQEKQIPLKCEKFPVDTVALWKATNRSLEYTKNENVSLSVNNNNHQTLHIPEKYKDTQALRQIVARELGFICMNVRSHLLPSHDNERKFTKKDIVDAQKEGGFLGKLMMGVSIAGLVVEQSEYEQRKQKELDEAWKVATAILIPINAYIYIRKQKILTDYRNVSNVFNVSDSVGNVFLKRIVRKYETNDPFF